MPGAILRLPPHQLARAKAAYQAAAAPLVRAARSAAVLAVLVAIAAQAGEADPLKFLANIHRLPDYIRSLVPPLTFAHLADDLADWFWNLDHWLGLLLDTVLMAYLGTLFAAAGAFALCFLAAENLEKRGWVRFAARRGL